MLSYRISSITRFEFYRKLSLNNKRYFMRNPRKEVHDASKAKFYVKALFNGVGVGLAMGLGYTFYSSYKSKDNHFVNERQNAIILDELPRFKTTRKILNSNDSFDLDLILFQYQTCPFSCKVRAFLDSCSFSYSVVEVSIRIYTSD